MTDDLAAEFEAHADVALAIARQTFPAAVESWPGYCRCPGVCEGGPECVDPVEGFPLPRPSAAPASDCWRCGAPGRALRHDGAVYCWECMKGTPGVYGPLAPPG